MVYNSHVSAGVSMSILKLLDRLQDCAKLPVNDGKVSNSIDSLNLACVQSLFNRYCAIANAFFSSKLWGFIPVNHVCLCNTRLSWKAHSYVVYWPVDVTWHERQNSFSSSTIRMWNSPCAEGFTNNLKIYRIIPCYYITKLTF